MTFSRRLGGVLAAGVALLAAPAAKASSGPTVLFREDFEAGLTPAWVERGFPSIARRNTFALARDDDGNHYLSVESSDSYSARGVYLEFSPSRCRDVSWRWRVSNVVTQADIGRRDGDDAAAKLYIVFDGPAWWNPLDKRILVYIWDNRTPAGSVVPNTWLPDKERMIVLQSGSARAGGAWVRESVDLERDFRRAFGGEAPGTVEGIAFLADTDNTHQSVSAGFDDLVIRCAAADEGSTGP